MLSDEIKDAVKCHIHGLNNATIVYEDLLTGNFDYRQIFSNSYIECKKWITDNSFFYDSNDIPHSSYLNGELI